MSIDTVNDLPPIAQYTAAVAQTVFPYPFPIFVNADLRVHVDGVLKVLTTDYTVSGATNPTGGNVTFLVAPGAGKVITIYRDIAIQRLSDFQQNGPLASVTVNDELDRMTLVDQQLESAITRTVRVDVADAGSTSFNPLPVKATRAGKFIAFDVDGQPIASVGTGNDAALRADLAVTTVGNDGARLAGYRRTEAGSVARTVAAVLSETIYARDFGFSADDNAATAAANVIALNAAIDAAEATVAGAIGATVILPSGIAYVNALITLPNRVRLKGQNLSGTIIKAHSSFSGSYVFQAVNGSISMFDSILEDLFIDCNSVASLSAVRSDAWQENSGLRSVGIMNCRQYGVHFINGFGGASTCELRQVQIFGDAAGMVAGILCEQISSVGSFLLHVTDSIIAYGSTPGAPGITRGIDVVNDSLLLENVHFEGCTDCVFIRDGNDGSISLQNVSGGPDTTNILQLDGTFNGRLNMQGVFRNGATNFIVNDTVSETLTSPDHALYVHGNAAFRGGSMSYGQSATAAVIASSGTITTADTTVARVAPASNVTGIILAAGTKQGQKVIVVNQSAFSVRFAAASSNVGTADACIVSAFQSMEFVWAASFWWAANNIPYAGSATYDPPSLADGAGATTTVTVTGAQMGDFAEASFSLDLQGITLTPWISSANTVSVRFQNESGGVLDLGSGTLRARVKQA